MSQITWGDLKAKVLRSLNLEDELFITPTELLDYCEDAINFAAAEIRKLNIEDQYFEACAVLKFSQGVSDYPLPSDIYANKITRIIFSEGSIIYTIERRTKKNRYEDVAYDTYYDTQEHPYRYMLINNNISVGTRLRITPKSFTTVGVYTTTANTTNGSDVISVASATSLSPGQYVSGTGIPANTTVVSISGTDVTLSANCTATGTGVSVEFVNPTVLIYYIRDPYIPVDDDSVIDIPEFYSFIEQFIKVECIKKEKLNTTLAAEQADLDYLKNQMIITLTNMVPDQANQIEVDDRIYWEMS